MTISRKKTELSHMYQIGGDFLAGVCNEKYLGILISQDLSWASHLSNVSTKANQKLGFLKRNLKGSPADLKRMAYIAIVRSSMEYASVIWDPHQANHISDLEGVQRKAARWISADYRRTSSVRSMLQNLNLDTLEERRKASRLIFMFKILHEKVAVPPDEIGIQRNPRATRGQSTKDKLLVPRCNTTELQKHFVARTIPEWNRLSDSTTSAASVPLFRSRLTGTSRLP